MLRFKLDIETNNVVSNPRFEFGLWGSGIIADWENDTVTPGVYDWKKTNQAGIYSAAGAYQFNGSLNPLQQECLVDGQEYEITINVDFGSGTDVDVYVGESATAYNVTTSPETFTQTANGTFLQIEATGVDGVIIQSIEAVPTKYSFPVDLVGIGNNLDITQQRDPILKGFITTFDQEIEFGKTDSALISEILEQYGRGISFVIDIQSDCTGSWVTIASGRFHADDLFYDVQNEIYKAKAGDQSGPARLMINKDIDINLYASKSVNGEAVTAITPEVTDYQTGQTPTSNDGLSWSIEKVIQHVVKSASDNLLSTVTGVFDSTEDYENYGIATGLEIRDINGNGPCGTGGAHQVENEEVVLIETNQLYNYTSLTAFGPTHTVDFDSQQSFSHNVSFQGGLGGYNATLHLMVNGSSVEAADSVFVGGSNVIQSWDYDPICLEDGDTVRLGAIVDTDLSQRLQIIGASTDSTLSNTISVYSHETNISFSRLWKNITRIFAAGAKLGASSFEVVKETDLYDTGAVYKAFEDIPDITASQKIIDGRSVKLGYNKFELSGMFDPANFQIMNQEGNAREIDLTSDFYSDHYVISDLAENYNDDPDSPSDWDKEFFVINYETRYDVPLSESGTQPGTSTAFIATRQAEILSNSIHTEKTLFTKFGINGNYAVSAHIDPDVLWCKTSDGLKFGRLFKFRVPFTDSDFTDFTANQYKLYSVSGTCGTFEGWITRIKYSPLDGVADLELIEKL